ncbi:hypothetical protein ACRCUN_19440 [Mycobacterium sp. LTG2003]
MTVGMVVVAVMAVTSGAAVIATAGGALPATTVRIGKCQCAT